eukprot:4643870-Pleurochrysis_carterae.AAC.1
MLFRALSAMLFRAFSAMLFRALSAMLFRALPAIPFRAFSVGYLSCRQLLFSQSLSRLSTLSIAPYRTHTSRAQGAVAARGRSHMRRRRHWQDLDKHGSRNTGAPTNTEGHIDTVWHMRRRTHVHALQRCRQTLTRARSRSCASSNGHVRA